MTGRSRSPRWLMLLAAVLAGAALSKAALGAPATPVPSITPLAAEIRIGPCDQPADRVAPLATVAPLSGGERRGSSDARPVAVGATLVEVPLSLLTDGKHVVAVSEAPPSTRMVACGEIGGEVIGNTLISGVRPAGGTGVDGVAVFQGLEGRTLVTLYVLVREPSPSGS